MSETAYYLFFAVLIIACIPIGVVFSVILNDLEQELKQIERRKEWLARQREAIARDAIRRMEQETQQHND